MDLYFYRIAVGNTEEYLACLRDSNLAVNTASKYAKYSTGRSNNVQFQKPPVRNDFLKALWPLD
jgi:hypothetical protein